jgi:hypothetical protein
MKNPSNSFHEIEMALQQLETLLNAKNKKAEALLKLSEIKESMNTHRADFWVYERYKKHENTGYFENIKIKYSIKYFGETEPEFTHEREFKDYCLTMDTLRKMIRAERELHNQNESYLTAEIFLLDADCEDEE